MSSALSQYVREGKHILGTVMTNKAALERLASVSRANSKRHNAFAKATMTGY